MGRNVRSAAIVIGIVNKTLAPESRKGCGSFYSSCHNLFFYPVTLLRVLPLLCLILFDFRAALSLAVVNTEGVPGIFPFFQMRAYGAASTAFQAASVVEIQGSCFI